MFSSSYYGARTLITSELIIFFNLKEFAIFKQVVDKKLRHRLLTFCLTIHMHCIFLFIFILSFNAFTKLCTF